MRGTKPRLVVSNDAVTDAKAKAPTFLSKDAKAEWNRVMPSLARRKVLTPADLGSLENYCICIGRVRQAERAIQTADEIDPQLCRIQDKAMATARQLAAELGLTPVSRSRPAMRDEEDDDDLSGLDI